ncbi:hypothetical protein VCHENC01_2405 [Vibrio harveyi]|nr:hypothetical protein VCHENC01_2405 [Vibrio harveyi]
MSESKQVNVNVLRIITMSTSIKKAKSCDFALGSRYLHSAT